MKKLAILFFALVAFSCNNQPNKDTSNNNIETTSQVETTKTDIESKTDTITAKNNQDFTYQPADNNKTTQRDDSFTGFANFYKQFDKPEQIFTVKSDEDKTITCEEGTKITVNANSFVTETGKPVKGDIKIQLKEYYKTSDMLLANLTTTSNDEILETGGMIYIEAFNNGEKCELKKGATIEIAFPTKDKKDDMELFTGNWTSDELNWTAGRTQFVITKEKEIFANVETKPEFPGGEQKLKEFFSNKVKYPVYAMENGIQGTVHVGLTVNESGEIEEVQIVRGVNPSIDTAAISAVRQMPKWTPGKHKGKNVKVRIYIPIKFTLGKKSSYGISNQITVDTIKNWIDGETAERIEFAEDFEKNMNDENLGNAEMSEVSRYIFSSSNLGWINCDRFYKDNSPRVTYFVNIGNSKQVDIKIVFNNIKSILTGSTRGGMYTFDNVPTGQSVTLIAVKYENNQYYLAVKKTKISKDGEPKLDFEPVTMARLKTEMEKLNKI